MHGLYPGGGAQLWICGSDAGSAGAAAGMHGEHRCHGRFGISPSLHLRHSWQPPDVHMFIRKEKATKVGSLLRAQGSLDPFEPRNLPLRAGTKSP